MGKAFAVLQSNDPLRMAGATAFFTTFALPAILIIIIQLFGLFVSPKFMGSKLMDRVTDILGQETGAQIRDTLNNFGKMAENWYVTVGGFLFLLFVATTLFDVIKNSLNQIWNIRVKPHPGILFNLKLRARSLVVILLVGILVLIGLLSEGLEALFGKNMDELFPGEGKLFQGAAAEVIAGIILTIWLIILFRFLADGRPTWTSAIFGGLFTGILLTAGKLVIKWLLSYSNIETLYGTSGSIVLLLLFVFYSAFILYYGGSFIKVFSEAYDQPIGTVDKAYHVEWQQVS